MHYISQVTIDMKNENTMEAVRNPYLFHGAIEKAMDTPERKEKGRTLWRRDGDRILIVSETKPNLERMEEQFKGHGKAKEYSLPEEIANGDRLFFRLLANPARTKDVSNNKTNERKRVRVVPHTPADQMLWLHDKAEHGGFTVDDNEVMIVRSYRQSVIRHHDDPMVQFAVVQYEGYLTVTDVEKFRDAVFKGIGKEKAFGCGMLSIVRGENRHA